MSGAIVRTTTVPWGYGVFCSEHKLDERGFAVKANAQSSADAHNAIEHTPADAELVGTEPCS